MGAARRISLPAPRFASARPLARRRRESCESAGVVAESAAPRRHNVWQWAYGWDKLRTAEGAVYEYE
jgi:hypothetical protein